MTHGSGSHDDPDTPQSAPPAASASLEPATEPPPIQPPPHLASPAPVEPAVSASVGPAVSAPAGPAVSAPVPSGGAAWASPDTAWTVPAAGPVSAPALPVYPSGAVPGRGIAAPKARRGRLALVLGCVAVLVTVAVVAAVGLTGGSRPDAAAPAKRPSPSPSPTPLTPDAYQALLSGLDQDLGGQVQRIGAAHDPTILGLAMSGLGNQIARDIVPLRQAVPPTAVEQANAEFVTAMQGMISALGKLPYGNGPVARDDPARGCLGSAGMVDVAAGPAADEVRAKSKALATADPAHPYHVGSFLPPTAPRPPGPRPDNGAVLKRSGPGGSGQLIVKNQGLRDVAVSLVPGGSTSVVTTVYVRASSETTLHNVHDGTYTLYDTRGSDWDPGAKTFSRGCTFEKLDTTLKFTTSGRTYNIWTLTMFTADPSQDGTGIQGEPVDPGSYPS